MPEPPLNLKIAKYLRTRAITTPWHLQGCQRNKFKAAIVIPVLAESENLPKTLESLAQNPLDLFAQTLVICVVNQRETATDTAKRDNQKTLEWLRTQPFLQLNLCWIDATDSGQEFTPKEGVGLARKLGFDLALARLDWSADPLLISLDADTLVAKNYLAAIFEHFRTNPCVGAYLPFRHQLAATAERETAIRRYELYLRSYQFGLYWAGSPYAFIALGSALACRAQAYVAAGGMKRKLAGEDFYFLQQLAKIGAVEALCGTGVMPAARYSERVPFGTGKALAAEVEEGRRLYQFVSCAAFGVLKDWLQLIRNEQAKDAGTILSQAELLSPLLRQYLDEVGFSGVWQKLQQNSGRSPILSAFHWWFDGLRTRQLLIRIETATLRSRPELLVAELLAVAGYPGILNVADQLRLLEQLQGVPVSEPKEKSG